MKVLFVGDGWLGSNARSLANGFRLAGHETVAVDTQYVNHPRRFGLERVKRRFRGRPSSALISAVHRSVEQIASTWKPDVLFCFKSIALDQRRLLDTRVPIKLHYSPDDVLNPDNLSCDYLQYESEWDTVITTKSFNVPELRARTGKDPLFVLSAFDPAWHHLSARRGNVRYQVGFVGNRRPDRSALISELANEYGESMVVAGPGWARQRGLGSSGSTVLQGAYGEEYSSLIASIDANLVLLNSDNRDLHTCRSFEVPAAGGLVIGERTSEHESILEDGTEALMFSNSDELRDALSRVKNNPEDARRIAERGHRRISSGNHTYMNRAEQIIDHISQ